MSSSCLPSGLHVARHVPGDSRRKLVGRCAGENPGRDHLCTSSSFALHTLTVLADAIDRVRASRGKVGPTRGLASGGDRLPTEEVGSTAQHPLAFSGRRQAHGDLAARQPRICPTPGFGAQALGDAHRWRGRLARMREGPGKSTGRLRLTGWRRSHESRATGGGAAQPVGQLATRNRNAKPEQGNGEEILFPPHAHFLSRLTPHPISVPIRILIPVPGS